MSKWMVEADVDTIATIEFYYPVQFWSERTCRIEKVSFDEFAIYDHLTCGHVNLCHHHETTSYCSICGAKVVEEND